MFTIHILSVVGLQKTNKIMVFEINVIMKRIYKNITETHIFFVGNLETSANQKNNRNTKKNWKP